MNTETLAELADIASLRWIAQASGCERAHTHDHLTLTCVSQGSIALYSNQKIIDLPAHKLMLIARHQVHAVKAYSTDFGGAWILELVNLPALLSHNELMQVRFLSSQLVHHKALGSQFEQLCQQLIRPGTLDEKLKLLRHCLLDLLNLSGNLEQAVTSSCRDEARLIRQALDNCQDEKPAYAEIAQQLGYSQVHCNRLFKQVYSISMQAYFLNKKAAQARQLLSSELSLSELALTCGFYDQSHFNRIFKEIYQLSPARYRSLCRGKQR